MPLFHDLLFLMAMGNWGNTPTPANDPDAPDPVGNEGELVLEADGERLTLLVQSARLDEGTLTLEGEKVGGRSQFVLILDLSKKQYDGKSLNKASLRQSTLRLRSGSLLTEPSGEPRPLRTGAVKISSVSGSGPWEIDGDVELDGEEGPLSGKLQARVRL